ncbi:hypothetical protein EJ04DRAFT_274757 [Polyplosphaeria fusca]|uniref:Uncharacterized protein n=1 Tax=Polyplosphaeria fusca TaxID=682080 RepID=A0A9P4QXF9_9PLEO|nr:hypothetical protein EJ04DRAFT_274757 [Polyplosphaeria fusca]
MLLWPLGIIAIVARNVFKHFRGTMSNWNGFLFTMLAIAIWALLPFIDHILSVDPTALITDFRVCVASDAQVLAKARNTRLVCFAVREWFVAAAAILLVVYLISCFGAMWLNNKNADTSASRTAALMEASDPGQIQREVVAEPERATPSSARGDDVELAVLRNGVEDVHGEGPERLERARV